MIVHHPRERAPNPFDAERFAPGVIPWIGAAGEMDLWLARATAPRTRHQILGAHGSGKSTLLVHLARLARARGIRVVTFRGSKPSSMTSLMGPRGLVLVDEVAEMSAVRFACVRALAATWGHGLVVTAHEDVGFTTLTRREVDVSLVTEIVAWLVRERDGEKRDAMIREVTAPLLAAHDANVREVCFTLYDSWARG